MSSRLSKHSGLEEDESVSSEKHLEEGSIGYQATHLTRGQEELIEACEPNFVAEDDDAVDKHHDLERVASSIPSVNNIKSVPNGGLTAWLQVVSGFFIFFNTWGVVNTFGTYQTYYETGILSSSSPSEISWIGSVQAFMLMLVGSLTGPIYDAGYVRTLLAIGTFLIVFGQMMLSLCTDYYQVFLAQAVCIGIGTGCIFVPGVAIISTYFSTKIATAVGLAAAGSSIGGVIYPIVFYRLQPTLGFPWATRVLGFMMLGTLAVTNAVIKVRVLPAARRKFIDLSAWKEPPFTLFVIGTTIGFLGLYTPFFYIQSYAIQTHIASPNLAFYLLAIINAASTFGRILPNFLADRVGPFNVIAPATLLAGVLGLCLIPTHSIGPVIAICALYGFFSGTFVSLPPTVFVHITKNRGLIGTRMGMGFAVASIGILTGTPITGAILTSTGSFVYVWLFGGLMTIAGAGFVFAARVAKGGWTLAKVV